MKSRPILFSGAMVRAILDGRKTQTRRIVKHPYCQATRLERIDENGSAWFLSGFDGFPFPCPYGKPGDWLWVRETWATTEQAGNHVADAEYIYRATDPDWETMDGWKWKPSIFMPREACRITLEITAIRCERLRDIETKPLDIAAEGQPRDCQLGDIEWYRGLWESINGKASWEANPWVWVVEFRRVEP